ncbi:MAG: 50S ribosomal protein L4 [Clostridiales bacterium]|jgi:large subunit ribosomal protein L4|nr:50S ribosomal protein L4 [Clostridiales bacterium]
MPSVDVVDKKGSKVSTIELSEAVFGAEVNESVVHAAVVAYLANQRQGTKGTKTRAEVRGGGAKPWRQKGTGRARQGSRRAPHWTGGGVVFAPKSRDFSVKLNKKVKRIALKSVLSQKVLDKKIVVIDDLSMTEIKTKQMQEIINSLKLRSALMVFETKLDDGSRNAVISARNIPTVKTAGVNTINVYDILKYDAFVVTKSAVKSIEEVYA